MRSDCDCRFCGHITSQNGRKSNWSHFCSGNTQKGHVLKLGGSHDPARLRERASQTVSPPTTDDLAQTSIAARPAGGKFPAAHQHEADWTIVRSELRRS